MTFKAHHAFVRRGFNHRDWGEFQSNPGFAPIVMVLPDETLVTHLISQRALQKTNWQLLQQLN